MGISTIAKCDICGVERKATNHWFVASFSKSSIVQGAACIRIYAYSLDRAIQPDAAVLCGQDHLSQWTSKQVPLLFPEVKMSKTYEVEEVRDSEDLDDGA
jgi:hypothetical protein